MLAARIYILHKSYKCQRAIPYIVLTAFYTSFSKLARSGIDGNLQVGLRSGIFTVPKANRDSNSRGEAYEAPVLHRAAVAVAGGPGGIRTHDLRIKSPLLCRTELQARACLRFYPSNGSPSSASTEADIELLTIRSLSPATVARNLMPNALITLSTVANSGFPSEDSDL